MCTALSFKTNHGCFYGRNMDLSANFGQCPLFIPRNSEYLDRGCSKMRRMSRAVLGMGALIDAHPAMAEAMNEAGLACAGLNFAQYAHWEKEPVPGKHNIPPYDFILWVLGNHDTVEDVKKGIGQIELIDIPINENTPCPTLHWMVSDKEGNSIVVEKTIDGLKVHDNTVNVMTNDPPFDWHLINLREYIKLSPEHPKKISWCDELCRANGLGAGTLGMPGDFASVSRFVRIAFARANMPVINSAAEALSHCFHMLDYVAMVKGGVKTPGGTEDKTLYSCCMNLSEGIYYYKSSENSRISAVNMQKEDLDSSSIKVFPYTDMQDIRFIN